jgi:predicted dehydrogenase
MLRIAQIGNGGIGRTHQLALKTLAQKYDIAITAVSDVRKEYLEKSPAIWPEAKLYNDSILLLDKEQYDIVLICLPTYLHAQYAIAAMEHGSHVVIEKPVCLTIEEGDLLLETQKQTGVEVMAAQVLRLWSEYNYLKSVIEDGKYGKIQSLTMKRLSGRADGPAGFENWFSDLAQSGSIVLDLHIHDVDFLRYLFGEPDCFSANSRKNQKGTPEHIITHYRFGKIIASAEACGDYIKGFPFETSYYAGFENATIVFNSNISPVLTVYTEEKKIIPTLPESFSKIYTLPEPDVKWIEPYCLEWQYFLDCIIMKKKNVIFPLTEGIASVKQCLKELDEVLKF